MKPVSPVIPTVDPNREVVYAKDQPQYIPLPTHRTPDGRVLSRWQLSDEDLQVIAHTRSIFLVLHTFNQSLQPIQLSCDVPGGFDHLTYAEKTLPRAGEAEKPEDCACDFPDVVYYNMNGHHPTCPVWIAWAEQAYRSDHGA